MSGQQHAPAALYPPGKARYPFYRRLGGPQGRSGRAERLVATGIRSRTVQPVVSRCTDWATRPTHNNNNNKINTLSVVCWPFFTYPFLILRSPSPDPEVDNLSLSYCFQLVVGWRLSWPCRCFIPFWKSQNVHMHYQKCDIFYDLEETRGIWRPEPDFRGAHRDSFRDCPGKTGTNGIHCARSYTVQ